MTEEQELQQLANQGKGLSVLSWILPPFAGFLMLFVALLVFGLFAAAFIGSSGGSSSGDNGGGTHDPGSLGYMPAQLRPIFTKAADKYNVSVHLVAAIFSAGEHGGSFPTHGPWASSSVGASGPFQFMPATWNGGYADDCNGDGVKDIQSLDDASCGAAHYLAANHAKGMYDDSKTSEGNIKAAIFAYNHAQFYVDDVWTAYVKYLHYQP
jgi:peptidoglycan DL-endopeptidase CwlO